MATRYGITTAVKVNGVAYRSLWADPEQGLAWIIDQTRLPHALVTHALAGLDDAVEAIRTMRANPAFDVTPARLVTGLITERGVCAASAEALAPMFQ